MVSRRTWASISMTMAVLFFLFYFTGTVKNSLNNYNENQYYENPLISKNDQWKATRTTEKEVIIIGSKNNSELNLNVKQWCTYNKAKLTMYDQITEYSVSDDKMPLLILLDSTGLSYDTEDIAVMQQWIAKGASIVFCTLPEPRQFRVSTELAKIVGIDAVYSDKVDILGVEFFEGFLFGGSIIYKAEKEEELKQQDFTLEIPWYQTTSGIKAYAVGLMDNEKVKNEFMPRIIWRNSIEDAKIFAVNGDFMLKTEGIGILSGIMNECTDYYVYPVINAQNMSIINFPGFAEENKEKTMEVYSRTMTGIYEDIIWPTVLSVIEKNNNKVTFFLSPQYDYEDENLPVGSQYEYQMKQINTVRGEAGLSTSRGGALSVREKIEQDYSYFEENRSEYLFSAYYSSKGDLTATSNLQRTTVGGDMTTIITEYEEGKPLISFQTDNVTLQRGTVDGFSHTYRENLRVRSIETALGYSNIVADFHSALWPENEDDSFEKQAKLLASYVSTYWNAFQDFEKTTISESDRRVRQFLALDYRTKRENKTVSIDVTNVTGSSWFILRTHGEAIRKITGGEYKKLEDEAYLIRADQPHVEITLIETDMDRFFYVD